MVSKGMIGIGGQYRALVRLLRGRRGEVVPTKTLALAMYGDDGLQEQTNVHTVIWRSRRNGFDQIKTVKAGPGCSGYRWEE